MPIVALSCLHLKIVMGLASCNEPMSYADGSVATGKISHVGTFK